MNAEAQAFNRELLERVARIKTEAEALAKSLNEATPQQLFLVGCVEPIKEVFRVQTEVIARTEQIVQYSLIKHMEFGVKGVIKPSRGLGLFDVGLILTAWIFNFKEDPNCRVTCFCLACAWGLMKVKRRRGGAEDTFNWTSFAKRYRGWEQHPFASAHGMSRAE